MIEPAQEQPCADLKHPEARTSGRPRPDLLASKLAAGASLASRRERGRPVRARSDPPEPIGPMSWRIRFSSASTIGSDRELGKTGMAEAAAVSP